MPAKPSTFTTGTAAQRFHATDYRAMDRSLMPKRMPVVGYRGHLRNTKESTLSFGVSHWRPTVPPSRAAAAAMGYDLARHKGAESALPADPLLSA